MQSARREVGRLRVISFLTAMILLLSGPMAMVRASAPSQSGQAEAREVRKLELGKPIEREIRLRAREIHFYEIALTEGQFANIIIDRQDIDISVLVVDPDKKPPMMPFFSKGTQGSLSVQIVAPKSGSYRLIIIPTGGLGESPTKRYEIRVIELRLSTERERLAYEATALERQAKSLSAKGALDEAQSLAERALSIRENALGPDHPDVAKSLLNLASLHQQNGGFARAESLLLRALAILEKALGPDHLDVASPLEKLAVLYAEKGNAEGAEMLQARALTIREKALDPKLASYLESMAITYLDKGVYTTAENMYARALAIWEKSLNPDHQNIAASLTKFALLYCQKGEYAKAAPLLTRALAIREKAVSSDHPLLAQSLSNLAAVHYMQGEYEKAEPLYVRVLAITEKAHGLDDPPISIFRVMADLYRAKGDVVQSIAFQIRANEIQERVLIRNLVYGSEREKLLYLNTSSADTDRTLSLHLQSAPDDSTACRMALTVLLQRKGRALDAMADSVASLRHRASPEDHALLDRLSEAREQLSAATIKGPGEESIEQHRTNLTKLEKQVNTLESQISIRSAEFRTQLTPITFDAVQKAVPPDAALVEFASYRPFNPKRAKREEAYGEARYAAYVLRNQGELQFVELGEAKPIDDSVNALREALRNPKRNDVKRLARAVDEKVMQPVRKLLGQTRSVLLSPDGALNLIPFAALVDENNRYLVENYSFTYLTSGRDLLRLQTRLQSKQKATVIADPDFGALAAEKAGRDLVIAKTGGKPAKKTASSGMDFSRIYFGPLPGTAQEAQALKALLPGSTVLTQAAATETALKQVDSPRILHIATHGFFLEDIVTRPATDVDRALFINDNQPDRLLTHPGRIENPLLRSGLGLAGANLRKSGEDDGILTAAEAAALNLWGTKLVVLSACDTGVGEVKNGDGVYGLRRALVLAGSESQVMSLWPVSDTGTRDLMIGYYKGLMAGQGRSAALRNAQLRMLASKDRNHPYYWASFIQSGEWANLDGKRP